MSHRKPIIIPSRRYASEFRCIGAECEDTCCGGWPIEVDDETKRKYERKPDLRGAMEETVNGLVMCMSKTETCVKFEGGLCGIQKKYGEELLSNTCYHYPRTYRKLGEAEVMHAALSCPEVARNALFGADAFARTMHPHSPRRVDIPHDFLPSGIPVNEALHINELVVQTVQQPEMPPERHMARLIGLSETLEDMHPSQWLSATHFYLENPDKPLPPPVFHPDDPVNLFRSAHYMVMRDRNQYRPRIYATLRDMEVALGVSLHWEEGTIADASAAHAAWPNLQATWQAHQAALAPLLHRWLAAQASSMVFPFTGMSISPKTRATIFALNFATIRLALIAACHVKGGMIDEAQQLRIIQSLARTIDHIVEEESFFRAYSQPDWYHENRLRSLIGDTE